MQPPSDPLHAFAFQGNLQALQSTPLDLQSFRSISQRGQTVLYAACRSSQTSSNLVSYLIDQKGCDVNQANAPTAAGSFPQHGVVQTLLEAFNGTTALNPPFVQVLLDVLHLLKSKGANMSSKNTQHQQTALQEFQGFENLMRASAVSQLVPSFLQVLSSAPAGPPPSA